MSWQTSSSLIGLGAAQKQHEMRYEALAKRNLEDHKVAAALQEAINRERDSSRFSVSARPATAQLPRSDEVDAAAKVLRQALRNFGLRERKIAGDGNCQFRAVADQLFGSQDQHGAVRDCALEQMRARPDVYQGFAVGESFDEYLKRMASAGSWGDNLSLQAIADSYQIVINLITSFAAAKNLVVISPNRCDPVGEIWLGFYAEFHYVSIEHAD
jgi:hypothetical protein